MKIIKLAAKVLAVTLILSGASAQAQDKVEKPDLVLGVGGKSSLYYLPLTLAERLGYFKEQGLNVTITDFGGGSKSLQSLIGGFPRCGYRALRNNIPKPFQRPGHPPRVPTRPLPP